MTDVFVRGMQHVSNLPGLARRSTRVTQRLPISKDRSFQYHLPNRLPPPYRSVSTSTSLQASEQLRLSAWRSRDFRRTNLRWESSTQFGSSLNSHSRTNPWSTYARNNYASEPAVEDGVRFCGISSWSQRRAFHASSRNSDRRNRDGVTEKDRKETPARTEKEQDLSPKPGHEQNQSHHEHFYDRIHLPQFHRPTKEELLAAATGFWSRLKVRFKWLTIKSARPFNVDEIVGFISWIALGHVIWIVIGTTTFVSLAILAINTVFAQETLAGWIGNYLTKSSGIQVVFESAIVPKWGDGVITFRNVYVSRRPGQESSKVKKGSPEAAAQAASSEDQMLADEQNYTQFDITIGEINVTLSFNKWWNSKGPLQNVEVKHVRGIVDRTHVFWTGEELDPKSYRHEHNPGDFEIESFKIEDLLVTIHQPQGFRPFPVSIYNADLPRLRKQWLFYDFLSANSMTGEYDHSLFTIHPRQTHSYTGAKLSDPDSADDPWKKQSRIRVDALNIDHLNRGAAGPLSWIHEGNVDIVADIMIPNDSEDSVIKVMTDFYERMEETLTSKKHLEQPRDDTSELSLNDELRAPLPVPTEMSPKSSSTQEEDKRFLVMDLRIHLNDVRAVVPIFTRDLSYMNNALIRPIVAYINSRRTFIPINSRVVKRQSDFDGSWTIFDSGLMDDLSAEVYDAFARDVTDEQARLRRFKKVGLWSLQLAAQAIFLGMAGNIA